MKLFPAIDLFDSKAVRLLRGKYEDMTVYSENPPEIALDFYNCGAENIHIVDLEGAKNGTTPNIKTVEKIIKSAPLFAEVGGGIRDEETIKKYLDIGVGRVILGTAAITDEKFLVSMTEKYGDKIAVGVDIKDGFVAIKGWTEKTTVSCNEFCQKLQDIGVSTVICTDISKDGAMQGTNVLLYKELTEKFKINFIASGGVSSMDDIYALKECGVHGAIIGKAYYTGAIDLKKAHGVL